MYESHYLVGPSRTGSGSPGYTYGKTVCTFTLAVDRPFASKNGQREADFINIVTWNKTAELCGNSLTKGQRALVEGRLQIRSYDGKDGNKHYMTEVIADRVEFIERKGSGSPAAGQQNPPSQNQSSQGAPPVPWVALALK